MKTIVYLFLVLAVIGCAGNPQGGKPTYMPKPAPQPAPPPPRQAVSLDPALRETAKDELLTASRDNDAVIRANAIEAMQDTLGEQAADSILKGLDDTDPLVRFASAMAAGKLRLRAAYARLEQLAGEPDMNVKIGARFALHRLGDVRRPHDFE